MTRSKPPQGGAQTPMLMGISPSLADYCNAQGIEYTLLTAKRGSQDIRCQSSLETGNNVTELQELQGCFGRLLRKRVDAPNRGRSTDVTPQPCRAPRQKACRKRLSAPDPPADPDPLAEYEGEEIHYEPIALGDEERMKSSYVRLLNSMLYESWKPIIRRWINDRLPRKQSSFPYSGRKAKKPPMWPDDMIYKGPDGIRKEDGLRLALHFLRHPQYKSCLNALRESTTDIARSLKGTSKEKERVPLVLEALYDLRRNEDRLEEGGIDPDTEIYVPIFKKAPHGKPKGHQKRRKISPTSIDIDGSSQEQNLRNGAMPSRSFSDTSMFTNQDSAWPFDMASRESHSRQMAENSQCTFGGFPQWDLPWEYDDQGNSNISLRANHGWNLQPSLEFTNSGQSFSNSAPTVFPPSFDSHFVGSGFQGCGS